jgi:hypothetical protein
MKTMLVMMMMMMMMTMVHCGGPCIDTFTWFALLVIFSHLARFRLGLKESAQNC